MGVTFSVHFQAFMAVIFAIRYGRRDVPVGRVPFRIIILPGQRREVLLSSWKSVGKGFVLALVLEAIYQFKVYRWFYPTQALVVALFLAVLPYLLVRGPGNYLTR